MHSDEVFSLTPPKPFCYNGENSPEVTGMKLTYLGTAAAEGIPCAFCSCDTCQEARRLGGRNLRTRSQALIDDGLLLDWGADTYLHTLYGGLDLRRVHTCLITHTHCDHLYPEELENRRPDFALLEKEFPLTVCGSAETAALLRERLGDAFLDTGRVVVQTVEPFTPFSVQGYTVIPLPAQHGTAQPLVYIVQKDDRALLYAHDTSSFDEPTWEWLSHSGLHCGLVSLDCTAGVVSISYRGHMNFERDAAFVERLRQAGVIDCRTRLIANHFSHNGHINYDSALEPAVNGGLEISYDGMTVEF